MTPCPSCGADRGHLLGCEFSKISLKPSHKPEEPEQDTSRARAWGVPVALGIAAVIGLTGPGSFLLRILFGMWLHESGHALASWSCGVVAVPLPWITLGGESRSAFFIVLLFGGLGALGWRGWKSEEKPLWITAAALAGVLLIGVLIPFRHATTFIVFSGDGGAMVLGTLMMLAAVLLPNHARLARGGLRWGYLVIGAGAFMDAFITWVRSWRDVAELPFGRSESSGLSDALRLVDVSGLSETGLIRSYLALGIVCLAALAGVAARQLIRR